MTGVKRTDDVLLAFKRLRERGVDACLCMVGDGPERDHVERRAHELGIMRDTLFLGYQEDVAPYYAAFDAMVLPPATRGRRSARSRRSPPADPWSRRGSAACPTSSATARTASSSRPATSASSAERLARLAEDPGAAGADGRGRARARAAALRRRPARRRRRPALPVAAGRA